MPHSDQSTFSPLVFLISTDSNGQRYAVLAVQSFSTESGHLGEDSVVAVNQNAGAGILGAGILSAGYPVAGYPVAGNPVAGILGDSATILHAGAWIEPSSAASIASFEIPQPLVSALDQTLAHQGARFLQWATDGGTKGNASVSQTCLSFGMRPLATLEYLSVAIDQLTLDKLEPIATPPSNQPLRQQSLELVTVNHKESNKRTKDFESLVSRTYQDTLDCPALSQFRTASQTLRSYQDVDSYDPSRWYFVVSQEDPSVPVGCVIMATHGDKNGDKNGVNNVPPTSELVYMALVPEKRGQGLGRPLVKLALSEPSLRFGSTNNSEVKSPHVVLAVDQQNSHARNLYRDAGLRPLLLEKIWGKSVGDTLSTTT